MLIKQKWTLFIFNLLVTLSCVVFLPTSNVAAQIERPDADANHIQNELCEGDFDGDEDVDGTDLTSFSQHFGRTNCLLGSQCNGDFDNDGDVDGVDLSIISESFGRIDCSTLLLEDVFSPITFQRPVAMVQAPGNNSIFYVVEQTGKVILFDRNNAVVTKGEFIDIEDRVDMNREKGLLGMAFHPLFSENGKVYLSYTGTCPSGGVCSYISEFLLMSGQHALDPNTERELIRLEQPFNNHNGGQITFGPDGMLYIGFGDGGSGGDPLNHGQNTNTLLGALLRIDVDGNTPYGIPEDNPFSDGKAGRPEIYAYGLRNPWRWSFDRNTLELWLADVGQHSWEEVNIIKPGGNYGWNIREGKHCYSAVECNTTGLIDPIAEYSHLEGNSITGGYVYRGALINALQGEYVFGDYGNGRIWGITPDGRRRTLIRDSGFSISSFAEDQDGEVFVLDYFAGKVLQLVVKSQNTQ